MAGNESETFETKVARLEAIVKDLESGKVDLDKSIDLFKEGRQLTKECQELLSAAQTSIDREIENAAGKPAAEAFDDEIPF